MTKYRHAPIVVVVVVLLALQPTIASAQEAQRQSAPVPSADMLADERVVAARTLAESLSESQRLAIRAALLLRQADYEG